MTADIEHDIEAARAAFTALAVPRDEYHFNTELIAAGDFVAQYGILLDWFDGDELDAIRGSAWPARHSAAAMLAHWSAESDWVAAGDDRVDTEHANAIFQGHVETCNVCAYLEAVHNLAAWLNEDAKGCGRCGRGVSGHEFGPWFPDGEGEPHWGQALNSCLEPWQRAEPAALECQDLYPYQVGEGYSAIWYAPLSDGRFAVTSRTFYVTQTGDDDQSVVLEHAYLICTDPAKPWDSSIVEISFDEEMDDDPDSYDLKVMAERCEGPGRGEWTTGIKSGSQSDTDVPDFTWPAADDV